MAIIRKKCLVLAIFFPSIEFMLDHICKMNRVFEYTNTRKDILDSYDAVYTAETQMRPAFRIILISFGLFWGLSPVIVWAGGGPLHFSISSLLIWASGCAIVWNLLIRYYRERQRINKQAYPERPVRMDFLEDEINILNANEEAMKRQLNDLSTVSVNKKGLLFVYVDGLINWLPLRVFRDHRDLKEFASEINKRRSHCLI